MSLILHCGAPKCGSSALQTALTDTPSFMTKNGRSVLYGQLHPEQDLILGQKIKKFIGPRDRVTSFMTTANFTKLNAENISTKIKESKGDDILLSMESWLVSSAMWAPLLGKLNMPVHVVAYVRPHVPWLNSAWWQWGAWSDQPFESWIIRKLNGNGMWSKYAQHWRSIPNVEQVTIRLLDTDIIEDFFVNVLNAEPPATSGKKVNQSLPESVLRLFQRNRKLRQGPHGSLIEHILGKYLDIPGKPPWVISPELISRILSVSKQDNLDLLPMLQPEQAKIMHTDPRWWSVEAYEGLSARDPQAGEFPPDELEKLCVGLVKALRESALG